MRPEQLPAVIENLSSGRHFLLQSSVLAALGVELHVLAPKATWH